MEFGLKASTRDAEGYYVVFDVEHLMIELDSVQK